MNEPYYKHGISSNFSYGMSESKKIKIFEFPASSIQIVGLFVMDNNSRNMTIYKNPLVDCTQFLESMRNTWLRDGNESIFDKIPKEDHEFKIIEPSDKMQNNLSTFFKNKRGTDTGFTFEASEESSKPTQKK